MIAHEAKPHQPHGHFFVCLSHQFDESEEVIRLVKNIIATVTAIKNVLNKTALRCSGCAWHSITITTLATQLKYNVPFLHSLVNSVSMLVHYPEIILPCAVILVRGETVPFGCFSLVLINSPSCRVMIAETVLRSRGTLNR